MKEEEDLQVDEEISEDEAFIHYDIASYPSDLTLSGIEQLWVNKDIVIPDFQRKFVWNIKQASLLIESFLIGLPVPQVFFYVDDDNRYLVIDGQQRITSIVYYFGGFFGEESQKGKRQVFRLEGLDEKSPYANKKFEELSESDQRKLKGAVLRAMNIKQLSPRNESTSIYHIFERLNTGGTPLKPQEIRNCVYRGELVSILAELNIDKNWRKILGKTGVDKHQKDIELILRVLSLSGTNGTKYEKPMKEFLNRTMMEEKSARSKRVRDFANYFPLVAKALVDQVGERPFHLRGPLNTAALDSVFCTLLSKPENIPLDLKERLKRLFAEMGFISATYYGTSDVANVQTRLELAKKNLLGE